MKYLVIKNSSFNLNAYALTTIRKVDIFHIMEWRNQQIKILRQNNIISKAEQISYYENTILPSFTSNKPKMILFSFLYNKICIGYGGFTNIDWHSKRAELSFLLDTKRTFNKKQYAYDFTIFLNIIKYIAFNEIKFNRLFTETFDFRSLHIKILEKNNFKIEGILKKHIYIKNKYYNSLIHAQLIREFKGKSKIYVKK